MIKRITLLIILLTAAISHAETPTIIVIGTQNPLKVQAVREVVEDYPCLSGVPIAGESIPSGVSEQPTTRDETILGAKNRAEGAYRPGGLGIGIESGVMEVPCTGGQYMDHTICSIFDGENHHIGISCGFRLPKEVARLLVEEGCDLDQAMKRCGFTDNPRLGAAEGAIGVFTNGRISRKEYSKQALITALISVENSCYFPEFVPVGLNG